MLHFMSVQPSLYEEVDGLVEYLNIPYKLYWENGIYKYRNVPLEYVTCNKAYVDIPEQSDVYSLDLDCLKNDYTEIALLLKSFTFNTYGRAEDGAFVECEVTYTGFTDPDRTYSFGPEGQSIQISSYLSGCNWQSLSSLPTDDGNMQYVPLFDYSTVTDMDLYNGTPFILINP